METFCSIAEHLRKLCVALSSDPGISLSVSFNRTFDPNSERDILRHEYRDYTDGAYELALSYLSSTGDKVRSLQDERLLCQKVYAHLSSTSMKEADKFTECYQKLKNCLLLKQKTSMLCLLYALAEKPQQSESTHQFFPVSNMFPVKSNTSNYVSSSTSKATIGSISENNIPLKSQISHTRIQTEPNLINLTLNTNDRPEKNCVRDAILAATGVRTKSSFVDGTRPTHILYARIAHLGFLHNWLKEFVDPASGVMPQGLMGEGLVTAIKMELAEYYRSVALLQSQTCENSGSSGTLRRVCVWAQEPLHRLTWLTNITHTSQHKKGGELASCVHRFAQHGDERVAQLARRLLTALTYPLLVMLTRWLLHGIIDDPFNEFFIECRSTVGKGNMWHERYKVRQWMVPSFMSQEQAAQILATGKSVVFMREACADEPDSSDHAHHLQALLKATTGDEGDGSSASSWWEADGLRAAVCAAHETATHRLLAALTTHHHLLDHLTAHRRYLLLTQGDFAHHLMTLIRDELNKPANSQYVHNLSCTLEAAVRATNAQFEPPHVLSRLYVNLVSEGDIRPEDSGWDIFVLQYRVEEPLDSVFHAQCQMQYRALFLQLWRIKRIEYNLHEDWRHHTILQKRLKYMPEVWSLMRRVSCFRAEALRMCSALQEACFVGAEAAWAELFTAVAEHRDLDTLLHLHFVALERQSVDALIHKTTEELQSYLRNVLGETLALHSFEATLHAGIEAELERRDAIETLKGERFARGEYALTAAEEAHDKEKRKIFNQFLVNRKADLNVWARTFRGHVSTLILKLALHEDAALQTLAFQLDYSDFYKRANSKLHEPLTYQHKRLSEIGLHRTRNTLMDLRKKK